MESIEDALSHDRALVYGIGGGGDVVGAVPTARFLEAHGVETVVGGLTWERFEYDPEPGPRSFDELRSIEVVSDAVALGDADTETTDGIRLAESEVAAHYGERVALVDPSGGAAGLRDGLAAACDALDVDLVVGTDSGGDALAAGDEPGLRSPLADAVSLAALASMDRPTCLGMFGYGSDGELSLAEIDDGIGRAAARDGLLGAWGLTPPVVEELEGLLARANTEASRLPVEAARGEVGERAIRGGTRTLRMTPAGTVTFYLDPAAVAATSRVAELVAGTPSLAAANEALESAGYDTELGFERERAAERNGGDE